MKVVSIGDWCLSASLIKSTGFREAAYPFDWNFTSTLIIKDSLSDNFKDFLDRSQYENNEDITRCLHKKYKVINTKAKHMFNHKNPLLNDEDYEYYVRAVERFTKIINSDEKIIFFRCILKNNYNNNDEVNKDITESIELLNKYHSNNIYLYLVVEFKENSLSENYTNPELNYYSFEKRENLYVFNIKCIRFPATHFHNVDLNNKITTEIKSILESYKENTNDI